MLDTILTTFAAIIAIALIWFIWTRLFRSVTIYEYQKGLKFKNGQFQETLGPGRYTYYTRTSEIGVFDLRPSILPINGQDLLTADQASVKISLSVSFKVINPKTLTYKYENYREFLYNEIQLKLRDIISRIEIEGLVNSRNKLNEQLNELTCGDGLVDGLTVLSAEIRDIMLTGDMKKTFSEVIKAKIEAQSALEKARGEAAVLRSLANSAKMMENNPELAKLRLIQTIESTQGNTFVLNTSENKSIS